MPIRVLPDDLINQIAAGEVVERPASVVKELVENAIDAGADQIVIDVIDGGRTLISVIDNGSGMARDDLEKSVMRHATSKLSGDDLFDIQTMGFRGEALPSIASVSDMTIDTKFAGSRAQSEDVDSYKLKDNNEANSELSTPNLPSLFALRSANSGLQLNCTTLEIKPSPWESGTRVRVENLFFKTPARLKFLRSDRAEMMSIVDVVKRLALSRPDVGFILNNKWRFPKGQDMTERVIAVIGEDARNRMIKVESGKLKEENSNTDNFQLSTFNSQLSLYGFISEPTLRRASSVDQYLFVNGRPVKDKVLVGALRAAYLDVMSAREFPLCALYLELPPKEVDVNVSPAKTEVHFLEPSRVRGFIIRTIRDALAEPTVHIQCGQTCNYPIPKIAEPNQKFASVREDSPSLRGFGFWDAPKDEGRMMKDEEIVTSSFIPHPSSLPLGRVVGQIGNKYIIAENKAGLVIVDQHAAHERITYEKLRAHELKRQPLLVPAVIKLKPEEVAAVTEITEELDACGLKVSEFGIDAVAVYEKPADWDMDWAALLRAVAQEVIANGHSSQISEKLHLKLANYACHHSVRAGLKLSYESMDALLRDVEKTERAGQCNHGRPVYKVIPIHELDGWFERV